ncbi:tetratricopeptide repeat protein [Shewanella donghaensis]|uniref:tetratricopeptide repeat protein n=1 Tax=Shewanella donghaensis TaxID=238836 RepID=UPI001182E3FD|nr:tetratricopeptide repeat protein [Shewanella donghaensis]
MLKVITRVLTLLLFISFPNYAADFVEREIAFQEDPNDLFEKLSNKTKFPLSFNGIAEFEKVAKNLNYQPQQLQRDLGLLARLYLHSPIKTDNKTSHARLLTQQLQSIATTPIHEAIILLLEGRIRGVDAQQYKQTIILYKEALNKINNLKDDEAMTLKFIIHGDLCTLFRLLKQDSPALHHYKQYRDLAYQMRVEYFIAQAETAFGKYYVHKNQLAKALQHYNEAFRITNRLDAPVLHAHTQFQLARVYRDLGQWDDALKNANEAAISFQALGQEALQSKLMTVIAMIYAHQEQWNKALDYYLNAQQIDQKNGHKISQALNFNNIGEAYLHLKNYQSSVSYLEMANKVFKESKVLHYLVYNELLLAQVALEQQQWTLSTSHALVALEIGEVKDIIDAQEEALEYLSISYRETNNLPAALKVMDKIIALNQNTQATPDDGSVISNLNEEKLKLDVSALQHKLSVYVDNSKDQQMAIIILLITILILSFVWLFCLKRLNTMKVRSASLLEQSIQEPLTELKGYRGVISQLNKQHPPKTVALVNIEALTDIDIEFGLTESKSITANLVEQCEQEIKCDVFVIRTGEVAICCSESVSAQDILDKVEAVLSRINIASKSHIPHFSKVGNKPLHATVGHINLPLLADPDLRLTAELKYETVQYALAAAKSIDSEQTYVSIRTLNFAPAAIFFKPLYLNLTHALQRGIIRAESNRSAADIKWPTN